MKRWQLLAGGLGLYAVALVATAPSALIDQGLSSATAGRVRLAETQGSPWSGEGRLEVRDESGRSVVARRLGWRWVARDLLSARVGYRLVLAPAQEPMHLKLSLTGLELSGANIELPAAALGQAVPGLEPFGLSGRIDIRIASLSTGRDSTRVQASVVWRDAASSLSPLAPLGDYALGLSGTGPEVKGTLSTLAGPLQLDGGGRWSPGGPLAFQATATVPAAHRELLAPFLRLVAVEQPDGGFIRQTP